mgnify:CR=1 FL=1
MANPPVLGIAQELRAITLSPGLLSRRVTSLEVANSRTSHSRQRVGTLVSYFKLSSQVQQLFFAKDAKQEGCQCTKIARCRRRGEERR